jgi:hypothetical protein
MNIDEALQQIKQLETNGCNYDVSNEEILDRIQTWHQTIDVEVLEVTEDSITLHFKSLPADTRSFAQEIYEFCPDIIDQHFGCFDEIFEAMEESAEEIPEAVKQLIEGVDFGSENYGLDLLEKVLKTDGRIQLWWD